MVKFLITIFLGCNFFLDKKNKCSYNGYEVIKLNYKPFETELAISNYYKSIGILEPYQIDLQAISDGLSINLTYTTKKTFAFESGRFRMINVDASLPEHLKREHYFHELCHVLRHYGSQLFLASAFIQLQEYDAVRFTRYAAIPYHMIKLFDLHDPFVIKRMAQAFCVSEQVVSDRLEGILRNSLERGYCYG